MKQKVLRHVWKIAVFVAVISFLNTGRVAYADSQEADSVESEKYDSYGGGYAATGQITDVEYTTEVYNSSNGLPTSDAMCVLGASDGYVWIGGYAGVIRYDGTVFERMDTDKGLTSARGLYEDSKGRIWVGTNDNGVVVIDGEKQTRFDHKDGLPSYSIRDFTEDDNGNMYIATTAGVCYADSSFSLHDVKGADLSGERILKLDSGKNGKVYGQTSDGLVFAISDGEITELYTSEELNMENIKTILVDPEDSDKVYFGTESNVIYHGRFGDSGSDMEKITTGELEGIHWLNYDCGHVWVSSNTKAGYLDEQKTYHELDHISVDSGIEMMTSDYQGNIWLASSTQGVMKLVTNNFVDVTKKAGLQGEVANVTCYFEDNLYVGNDAGLQIIDKDGKPVANELTDYIGDARVRCIKNDSSGNLWICTYTNDLGLICFTKDGEIKTYTEGNGMPHNQTRTVSFATNGDVLVGTNGGLAVIRNDEVIRTVGVEDGIQNTVFLTVEEAADGNIWVGSDGDGIYVISDDGVEKLSRDDGLTSEVVIRLCRDDKHDVLWIITSNSIEYLKDGKIKQLTSFPYNNNYDIFFDGSDNAWIMSSFGLYCVSVDEMLDDSISDYRIYTVENGMPYSITANSFSSIDDKGNIYIPGREGVIKVNLDNYYETNENVKMDVHSVYCGNTRITPDERGEYRLPASKERIQIGVSVLDYTMLNPTVHFYLDGVEDDGVTVQRSKLSNLEYTYLPYGMYRLHIQVVDRTDQSVLCEESFIITKKARISELMFVRVLLVIFISFAVGVAVWRIMKNTVVARQYEEIRLAKENAENANTAKSRFLANMSHEIRTPINTIMGMNEMIMREDSQGVPKEYFMSMMNYSFDIRNAAESLLGLINDLLDISKIESGKMHLVEQEYDVQDMLRSIVSMIRVRSTEKELTFDVVVDEILPVRLYGDEGKIKQIVLNLLTNAVKYTDVGGFVLSVSMDERRDDTAYLCFSVKDTGMGVKDEDREKLFTAYERLDEEKNSNIQGTGLGLNISRKFAELMDGSLVCESVYGEGSEFILTVAQKIVVDKPLGVFIEHDESKVKGPYIPQFVAPDADILVVDDNPMNLTVIKGLLKATRVFVTTSSSGEDAVEKVRDSKFNVVLMDHMMPGMDGVEAVGIIREFDKDLPVYALTANATVGEEFYKSKGFNGYLSKPIESETLEKTIMKHIPEEMMEKPTVEDVVEEDDVISGDMQWLYETDGLIVEDGINYSGGVSNYIFSLNMFLDTIDENSKVIRDAFESENYRLYTIKVHALKSSARIIGAKELSALAAALEDAGNKKEIGFIIDHTDRLLSIYESYKDKLKRLKVSVADDSDKEEISAADLADAYGALTDCIGQMDYDAVEMIIEQLKEFKLPKEDARKVSELDNKLRVFDWDGMEKLIETI